MVLLRYSIVLLYRTATTKTSALDELLVCVSLNTGSGVILLWKQSLQPWSLLCQIRYGPSDLSRLPSLWLLKKSNCFVAIRLGSWASVLHTLILWSLWMTRMWSHNADIVGNQTKPWTLTSQIMPNLDFGLPDNWPWKCTRNGGKTLKIVFYAYLINTCNIQSVLCCTP